MTTTSHDRRSATAASAASAGDPTADATWPVERLLQLRPSRGTPDLRFWPTLETAYDSIRDGDAVLATAAATRVWAWWLGDAKTTAADRRVAAQLATDAPALPELIRAGQHFRDTAVRDALHSPGFTQLLDLAAGVPRPTPPAGAPVPRPATVIRVEQDPVTVRLWLDAPEPGTTIVAADLSLPDALLDLLTGHGVLNPTAPALVLLNFAVHHLSAFQSCHLFDVLGKRLHPGSRLILTALVSDPWTAADRDRIMSAYTATPGLWLHPAAELQTQLTATGWHAHNTPTADGLLTAIADLPAEPQP